MKTWIVFVAAVAQVTCLAGTGWAQAFTRIISPVQNQCVPGPDVTIKFEAGGMTLGASSWNLHFMLDDEPFQVQYDGNHAHVFKNVLPGTHTVRMFAANAMQEAIPGTQSTMSFSVAYGDKANYVMPGRPALTYNLPQGEYLGVDAADITVDWLLENVSLSPNGYKVAYYADGRRFFVTDQCGPRHLKNLNPGFHRVRIELQDQFGDLVPGAFNSTERVILVSPDSVAKSPAPVSDGYDGLPHLDSVKGSMTMGQPWSATEAVHPLIKQSAEADASGTEEDQSEEAAGETGAAPAGSYFNHPNRGTSAAALKVAGEGYAVRSGGTPEADVSDLDAVKQTNVRRGSIVVNNGNGESLQNETDSVEVTEENGKVRTAKAETTSTSRIRADGTTSTVHRTTETLKLQPNAGLRAPAVTTTRTVTGQDPRSTTTAVRIISTPTPTPARIISTPAATVSNTASPAPATAPVVITTTPASGQGNNTPDANGRRHNRKTERKLNAVPSPALKE